VLDESKTPETPRLSPAERLEQTRARLLNAVIESLAEVGYAATTTTEVARRSGLTRGAQLHHFGTKDQMMLAAAKHLNTREHAIELLAAFDAAVADEDRVRAALAVLAEYPSGPFAAAYVELYVGSRGNPELLDALHEADEAARDSVRDLFGQKILSEAGPEFDALLDTAMYALRGMALDSHLATAEEHKLRRDLILGLEKYIDETLRESRTES
jgi:AcrR family transcriptional regulator